MLQLKVRILMFLGLAAIWVAPPIVCQKSGAGQERIIRIPSASGEPALVLQISTERSSLAVRFGRGVSYRARALRQELFRATLLAFLQPIYSPTQDDGL